MCTRNRMEITTTEDPFGWIQTPSFVYPGSQRRGFFRSSLNVGEVEKAMVRLHTRRCHRKPRTQPWVSSGTNCLQSEQVRTPVDCSWANGRVERFHRTINEKLRRLIDEPNQEITFNLFALTVKKIGVFYNTAVIGWVGSSPHDQVFTFQAWISPSLRNYRRLNNFEINSDNLNSEVNIEPKINPKTHHTGEIWL